ncbi:MAG TPA: hypothetical protein VGO56_14565 [Pyrinomonadaceae bacterium]|jgi:hypothetical protein|nr:hypothetical protein [Pyrinomonadaceae bacterium]
MDEPASAQTSGLHEIVESLDREFARLYFNSCALIEHTSIENLYSVPNQPASLHNQLPSIGESVLRSAAAIEQAFGGITANLWDDPFEWTLPEYLSTPTKITEHLAEVEAMRKRAFSSFSDDSCLGKHIALPAGETRPLIELLQKTLVAAAGYQARALSTFKILSGTTPPGFII